MHYGKDKDTLVNQAVDDGILAFSSPAAAGRDNVQPIKATA